MPQILHSGSPVINNTEPLKDGNKNIKWFSRSFSTLQHVIHDIVFPVPKRYDLFHLFHVTEGPPISFMTVTIK